MNCVWQITLHEGPEEMPYYVNFVQGPAYSILMAALTLRRPGIDTWIRIEEMPGITLFP